MLTGLKAKSVAERYIYCIITTILYRYAQLRNYDVSVRTNLLFDTNKVNES